MVRSMRLPGQRQVRQEVAVQITLMRQTGPGNSLVRDQPGDGLINDPRRAGVSRSVVVEMVPYICIRLEADPLRGATGWDGVNRIRLDAVRSRNQRVACRRRAGDRGPPQLAGSWPQSGATESQKGSTTSRLENAVTKLGSACSRLERNVRWLRRTLSQLGDAWSRLGNGNSRLGRAVPQTGNLPFWLESRRKLHGFWNLWPFHSGDPAHGPGGVGGAGCGPRRILARRSSRFFPAGR